MPLRLATNVLGVAILIAMIVGGGTQVGLASDDVVKVALTIASVVAIFANRRAVLTPFLLIFPLAALAIFVLQVTPLPADLARRFWAPAIQEAWSAAGAPSSLGVLTINVDATLGLLAQAVIATLFFWACLNVDSANSPRLVSFFIVGWVINLVAGVIQMVVTNFESIDLSLSYSVTAGLFANINHFGLFMAMGLPPLIVFALKQKSLFSGILIPTVLIVIVAGGSRSALGIAILLGALGLFAAGARIKVILVVAAIIGVVVGILGATGFISTLAFKHFDAQVDRPQIYATVWTAIKNNPIFGSGFGTFLQVYPIYENPATITPEYVNRAHNDYLEAILEGGLPMAGLIAVYFAYLTLLSGKLLRLPASPVRDTGFVALLAIVATLLQSAVDYPLRTWIILTTFIYSNAILIDAITHQEQASQAKAVARKNKSPTAAVGL